MVTVPGGMPSMYGQVVVYGSHALLLHIGAVGDALSTHGLPGWSEDGQIHFVASVVLLTSRILYPDIPLDNSR